MKTKTQAMTMTAVMTAVISILAPLSVPVPFSPVPISFSVMTCFMAAYFLGWKRGLAAYGIYLLLGLVGIPVFSNFGSGFGKLMGPTGGYLIGFLFMILISGIFFERFSGKWFLELLGMVLGLAVMYAFGTAWLAMQMEISFFAALMIGVVPYLVVDGLKIAIVLVFCPAVQKRLYKAIDIG